MVLPYGRRLYVALAGRRGMPQERKTLCAVGLGGMLGIQDNTNMIPERGPQTVVLSNLSWLGFLVFIADSSSFSLLLPPSSSAASL